MFDRIYIVHGFAVLLCQRLGRVGLLEKGRVNLEIFRFDALANALQSGHPNRMAFLFAFLDGKILRWLRKDWRQVQMLTIASILDRRQKYLFAVPAALSFD